MRLTSLKNNTHSKTWSFDIDGVLNDYPNVWLDYIYKKTGKKYISKQDAKKYLGSLYLSIKNDYRRSDYKYQVPIRLEAKCLISRLRENGDKIIISTTRPFSDFDFMKDRTKNWLDNNNIQYDYIISKCNLHKEKFDVHIDDSIQDILDIRSSTTVGKFVLYAPAGGRQYLSDDVQVVSSLKDIR